jgi:molecular chaperone Hsp33
VGRDYSVAQAGGFLVQVMPGCPDNIIDALEGNIKILPPLTEIFEQGATLKDIMHLLFLGLNPKMHETLPVKYACNCTRIKVEKALLGLGEKTLKTMLTEDRGANVHCHFCNVDYNFTEADLNNLLQNT